jgi:hypothetical protein
LLQRLREASLQDLKSIPTDLGLDVDAAQWEGNRSDYAADRVFRGSKLSRKKSKQQSAPWRLQFLFFHMPKIWRLLAVLCLRYF